MKNKKIAILKKDVGIYGGIEHQIFLLAKGLKQKGHDVIFFTDNYETELIKRLETIGSLIKVISFNNLWVAGKKIGEYCKENQIDIIQSHMLKDSFIARFAKMHNKKLKHIFRVHTYIDCSYISNKKKDGYHFLSKLTDPWVDCYLSINEFNVNELVFRTHINRQKIEVIHDGVPSIGPASISAKEQVNHIAMIANFYPFKGHDILVKGIKLLKDEGILVKACIIGGEAYAKNEDQTPVITNKIRELCNSLEITEQVEFCGFVTNIYEKIKNISIIVLPSYMEGTPNSLLEAMSLKKIVVASNVGGIPEFIKDGVNGFIHTSRSPEAFAETLKKVLNLDETLSIEIRENAYMTWLREHSESSMIKQYINFINSL